MSALFSLSPRPPLPPFHSFMLRGCHSSIKATNGTRKTFRECIVVHPQVCSLFLLKALELGIFLGLPIESAGYTLLCCCYCHRITNIFVFINPYREMFPCNCFHVTVSFLIVLKGHLRKLYYYTLYL